MKGEALDGRMAPMVPLCSVLDEPAPGFLRNIWMGEEGVLLFVAQLRILIPISELWAVADAAVASMAGRFVVADERASSPALRSGEPILIVVADERASSPALRSGEPILSAKIVHISSAGSIASPLLPFHEVFAILDPAALRRTACGPDRVSVRVGESRIYIGLAELLKLAEAAVPAFRPSPGRGLTKIDA
jgi:hypothetical protein